MTANSFVTIEGRNLVLQLNPRDLLNSADAETVRSLVDDLACHDAVIEMVADQIISGSTELASHGSKGYGEPVPSSALEKAIRAVAISAGDVAAREIEQISNRCVDAEKRADKYMSAYYALRRHFEARGCLVPSGHEFGVDQ